MALPLDGCLALPCPTHRSGFCTKICVVISLVSASGFPALQFIHTTLTVALSTVRLNTLPPCLASVDLSFRRYGFSGWELAKRRVGNVYEPMLSVMNLDELMIN